MIILKFISKNFLFICFFRIDCPRPISAGFVWLNLGPDLPVDIARGQSRASLIVVLQFIGIKNVFMSYYKRRKKKTSHRLLHIEKQKFSFTFGIAVMFDLCLPTFSSNFPYYNSFGIIATKQTIDV